MKGREGGGTQCRIPPQPLWNSVEREAGGTVLLVFHVGPDRLIVHNLTRENEARERIADLLLHKSLERTRTVGRVETALSEPLLSGIAHIERNAAILEARRERSNLEVDDMAQLFSSERVEQHDVVEAVEELWFERSAHGVHDRVALRAVIEVFILEEVGAKVGGQYQNRVPEVDRATLPVGETTVVEYLEEDVKDVGVSLLDLV